MSKRVLVVEDQEDNRQILRDLLASVGYEMIEAHDGEGALDAFDAPIGRCNDLDLGMGLLLEQGQDCSR